MRSLRFLMLAFVVVLAACGSSGSKTKTTATTNGSSSATTTAAASGAAIGTAQTGLGTVLVNSEGRTLYHFTKDSASTIACTGNCAVTWPPFAVPAGQKAEAGPGVTGTVSTVMRPDGSQQAAVNGQPLYTYSGDTKAGDTHGQGFGGFWFAVMANGSSVPAAGGGAAPAATTATTAGSTATTSGTVGGGY
jgi:predicted lipoprotein with Yx(FWY)xxD motif